MTTAARTMTMVTLQVWRLEKKVTDTNEYKQYTALTDGRDVCMFGFSRIGATWQWSIKNGGDATGRCSAQIQSKRRNGYDDVWSADVALPAAWVQDPKLYSRQIQDRVEQAFRTGNVNVNGRVGAAQVAAAAEGTPLSDLLDDCRDLVSRMADTSDSTQLLSEFASIQGARDEVYADLELADGYLDTLRLMIGAK